MPVLVLDLELTRILVPYLLRGQRAGAEANLIVETDKIGNDGRGEKMRLVS